MRNEERHDTREIADAFGDAATEVVMREIEVAQQGRIDDLRGYSTRDLILLNLHHGEVGEAKQAARNRSVERITAEAELREALAVPEALGDLPRELILQQNQPLQLLPRAQVCRNRSRERIR